LNPEPGTRNLSTLAAKAAAIKLILLDVDGVLTDGAVVMYGDGSEAKRFHIRDGIALVWAQRVGLKVGILSARHSASTTQRAAQLGISLVHQGVASKAAAYDQILSDTAVRDADVAYMGDDIVDLAVLRRVGLSAAPSDAVAEVRSGVDFVSMYNGGEGAVRELVEFILRTQGHWTSIVSSYQHEDGA
jgi:3-deoxy-D-manno-octulosonate 8-phosphate phosphatase (KDO 8-P phosphatase)